MTPPAAIARAIPDAPNPELAFLSGGGESGARMRAVDWSRTALGPPEYWPRSLKTIVRMLLDSRYAMWMLWGPEYTFFCNDAYLPTVGIKRDWVMGARSDKVWAEVWSYIAERLPVVNRGEATWDEALQLFLERSGFPEETYHTFSYSPVYDDENRIGGMLCVVTEVTDRVLAERGLRVLGDLSSRVPGASVREALDRAMAVLEGDPLDLPFASLYLLDASRRAIKLTASFGRGPASLNFRDVESSVLGRVLNGGGAEVVELESSSDLVPSPLWREPVPRALILPIQGSSGSPVGVLVAGASPRRKLDGNYRRFFDLVAVQLASVLADAQAYEAERHRAESLAELDRAKTQFFSNVSHEFRTPLTLMLGSLDDALIEGGADGDSETSPAMRERLRLAQRNARRLLRLVNTLLDFSRVEAGRAQAEFRPTDFGALTQDLASTFRSAIERAGLLFDVQIAPLSAPVWLDRDLWEKIVFNLLSNAYKFTVQGSIEVLVTEEDGSAMLEIRDTGVGVPADALPRLFERFFRVKDSGGRTHEGSGIGLALVGELVQLHGGRIWVDSKLGEGTTFRVTIPLGSAHLPEDRLRDAESARPLALGPIDDVFEAAPEMSGARDAAADPRFESTFGARVLLADDNADMRAYVAGLLAPAYRVDTVKDGEAALEAARRLRPDVIVSDVMMPRLDGFGMIRALRADESLRDIPVILLSARAGEESRIEGLDSGADDYLVKPFSARELTARVGALLERTRLNRATQRRVEQFETLFGAAPVGVYLVDSDLRIREVNPAARPTFENIPDLIGADHREVVRQLCEPEYAAEISRIFEHTLATGEPYVMSERIEKRIDRNTVAAYEWQVHRIGLPDGKFGAVCYFRDISTQVNTRLRLESADRQKDEFLAMLAHELRNPLASIRTVSELLTRTPPPDGRARSAIDIVKRQVSHLTRLVDDLLDISRITRARIDLKREEVPLSRVIEQALETVESMAREKGHHVTTTSDLEPVYVNGDPARLVQCVANLLTNAIKYSDPNGRIGVRTCADGDHALISVTDNGTGIAPELLPQIFDLFVQSTRTLDRSQGGLGVGLTVVRRLVEMHGGTVAAMSDGAGRGSTFTIRLPRVARVREPEVDGLEAPIEPRRVLVVDDNQDAAESLAMLMSLDGHEVRAVFSPGQGLEQLVSFQPQVMLLDIGLPDMDGYEVARRVRSMPEGKAVRLIALTGYGQAEDRRRALAAGFDDHLVKPVEHAKLQQSLARD